MADEHKYSDETAYSGARKITMDDALRADADDESLQRWKAALVSSTASGVRAEKQVVFTRLTISSSDLSSPLEFSFDQIRAANLAKTSLFTLKEKRDYVITFYWRVFNEIVMGLNCVNIVYRRGIRLQKQQLMFGCFAPQEEEHCYHMAEATVPSGILARGTWSAKAVFNDDDGNRHGECEYIFTIGKTW
eukprot:gnl/Dysnectes_brevis/995_a1110_5375.p1 GENE.gnl/Dysnectes_brevis/995_a1110_5375~~gnl/Dysnectes_brevis/995_a1110_5375.p1  ORF type:complete len:201 (-),score=57.71 gnl/Dysnectes_brevis/995_a1110_5375:37-606(-)